ncbi:MAG: ATP-binding protein [Christensenellales bacterium]
MKINVRGIGAKTTISHIALAVMVIFFAAISMSVVIYTFMRDYMKEELLGRAKAIAQTEGARAGGEYDVERMEMYENLTDAMILYIGSDYTATHLPPAGRLHFPYGESEGGSAKLRRIRVVDAIDQVFFARILSGEAVADIRSFQFVEGEIIFAGAPIQGAGGEPTGGIVLIQSINVFRERSSIMLLLLLIVAAVSISLAIAVSWILAGRLTKPIVEMTRGASRLAEGKYGQLIEITSNDELGELAGTLNALSARLRDVIGRLSEERDKLDLIVDGIGEGIIAADRRMRVVHCNQAFLELAELASAPITLSTDAEYGRILEISMRRGTRERAVWTVSGGRRLAAVASPLHSEAQGRIGAVCLVQDVSEAERLERMRRDYVANISHELRTPLTGIRGMVEPLLDGYIDTDEEKQDCYRVIYQETIRLEKLIRDMLDLSRLQDERLTVDLEPMEVGGIVRAAARRVAQTAAEAEVELLVDVAETGLLCRGNEDRILQVMTAFLDNAMSFTPRGGAVTAYARGEGGRVVMGVSDTGCGIEPKDLAYIWERFYKVDKSRMRTSGTGLGLAIAKLLVELMHGEIGVRSEPGKGADFWFTLKKSED